MGWMRKWGLGGLALGLLAFWLSFGVAAQELDIPASAPQVAAESLSLDAVMTLANRPIATYRVPFLGMSPAERVRRSQLNVAQALAQGGGGVVASHSSPQGQLIFIDGLMVIT